MLKKQGFAKKMLIIAPLRVCYVTWPSEIRKWAEFSDLTYTIIHGPDKEEALECDADIYIINVDAVKWLFDIDKKRWCKIGADVLVIDESTKFKHTNTERFKSIKRSLVEFSRRWILTGTPAPNGIMDLFGQIYILDLGRSLGRYITHFRNAYFVPDFSGHNWLPKSGALEDIVEKIKPITLRLTAEDWLKMPTLQVVDIPVTLPPKAREVYKRMENDFLVKLGSEPIIAANAAVAGGKCRQIANGAIYTDPPAYEVVHDEKINALVDLVEELSGEPLLIIYEYKHDYDRLNKVLPGPTITGKTGEALVALINDFSQGKLPYIYGHPASMGHGIDGLQKACSRIAMFGISWDLELYDQVIARIWRQGQSESRVVLYRIIAERTMDVKVARVLEGKGRTQADLTNALKA